jgi:hypothetical protein
VDYVVFGIGFGATLVLLGWALRTFGPGLRFRPPDNGEGVLSGAALLGKLAWTRFVSALGAVVATGGVLMLLSTFVTIVVSPRDRVGTIVVLSSFFLVLTAACIWAWIYIGRYGTHGILPDRTEPASPLRSPRETEGEPRRPRETGIAEPRAQGPSVVAPDLVAGPALPAEGPSVSRFDSPAMNVHRDDEVIEVTPAAEPAAGLGTITEEPDAESVATAHEEPESEPVEATTSVVVGNNNTESTSVDAPEGGPASETVSPEDDESHFVDVLPRPAPTAEESGRAEALRNLRARRSSRFTPDQS